MNKCKLLKNLPKEVNHLEEDDYALSVLKKEFPNLEKLSDEVIVVFKDNDYWIDYCFLSWVGSSQEETWYTPFWFGSGTTGSLKEARHSYIGQDGYVFYIKREDFNHCFDWLSKYFTLD